jgi:hypothetical protein
MRNGLTLDQAFDEGLKEMEWNGRKKWIDLFIEKILDVGSSLIFLIFWKWLILFLC